MCFVPASFEVLGVILLVLAVYLIAGKRGKGNIKDEQ